MKSRVVLLLVFAAVMFGFKKRCFGQNQAKADSIKQVLALFSNVAESKRVELLDQIAQLSSSPDEILQFADRLLQIVQKKNEYKTYQIKAYRYKGVAFRLKGDLKKSLESLLKAAKVAEDEGQDYNLAQTYLEVANTYSANNDFKNSLHYETKAIEIVRLGDNKQQLAINLLNTGYSYYKLKYLDSALLLYNEAEPIFEEIKLPLGNAYVVGNRALVYWKQGDLQKAERDLLRAIEMLKPLGDQFGMADYHNQLGNIFLEQNEIEKTIWHTEKALSMGKELGLKEQIRDASLLLSQLYTRKQQYQKALEYQTQFIAYKDSVENTEQTKKMADMRTEFEVNLREKEIDVLEKGQKLQRTYIIIAVILLLLSIVILLYFRQRFRTTKLMAAADRKQQNDRIKDLLSSQETKALQAMVKGRDGERKRLAQELHNHFGSLLATIKVNLNGLHTTESPKHETINKLVEQACTDVRNLSHSLNMGISDNFGLVPALKELTAHLQLSGGLKVELATSMGDHQLDSENEIIIYRIVQELVSNVLKHADASKLSISLTYFEEEGLVNIMVEDNGKGFDMATVELEADGMGLGSLNEMVVSLQGDIKFDSHPNMGTTVNIDLPIISQTNLTEL